MKYRLPSTWVDRNTFLGNFIDEINEVLIEVDLYFLNFDTEKYLVAKYGNSDYHYLHCIAYSNTIPPGAALRVAHKRAVKLGLIDAQKNSSELAF